MMNRVGRVGMAWVVRVTALAAALAIAAVGVFQFAGTVHAAGMYAQGETGYDISWPQCGATYPSQSYSFGIVGVTDGRAFTLNPCLASEYTWAQGGSSATSPVALYMNLNYPSGSTAREGATGPYGSCRKGSACAAQNYGWNAASYAFTQNGAASPVTASMWWLDIETGNTWSKNAALNADVIQGAIAYLQGQGATVGIYSTAYQWKTIAGGYAPVAPNWVAGASAANPAALCSSPLYSGGSVWLTQYVGPTFDTDYSC